MTKDRTDNLQSPQNRLLASLSKADFDLIRPSLEPVALAYKDPLYHQNEPIQFAYFIETGVASLVTTMKDGRAAEVGTIGNEGFVGLPLLMGDRQAPTNVYIQVAGSGFRLRARQFADVLSQSPSIRTALLRYSHAFFNQVAQSAACAHFHNLEQRCCRWLLMTRDRVQCDTFTLTQEFLAMMLGVRRASVTLAAGSLKRHGLILYSRGKVTVLDRSSLEQCSCECYAVTAGEFDRLLGTQSKARRY